MFLRYRFVEYIPEFIDEGCLYISIEFSTAVHKCVCGCGNKVVTPISSTDWSLTYYGDSISLYPSIGNWSFDCKSHYWIDKNKIIHARKWDKLEIEKGRNADKKFKEKYFKKKKPKSSRSRVKKLFNSKRKS